MLKPVVSNYSDASLRQKEAISKSWHKTTVLKVYEVYPINNLEVVITENKNNRLTTQAIIFIPGFSSK